MIIGLSIYQAFTIPMQLCLAEDFWGSNTIKTFDALINLTFLLDIIIRFRTTYIHPVTGEEVLNSFEISSKYLYSKNFTIDVLSTIPFSDFVPNRKIA